MFDGRLAIEVGGARHEVGPGEEATARAGSHHAWRNVGAETAVFHVELRPGHEGFEKAIRVAYALAREGRVLEDGTPRNPLKLAVLADWAEGVPSDHPRVTRALAVLARVARVLGVDRKLERRYV